MSLLLYIAIVNVNTFDKFRHMTGVISSLAEQMLSFSCWIFSGRVEYTLDFKNHHTKKSNDKSGDLAAYISVPSTIRSNNYQNFRPEILSRKGVGHPFAEKLFVAFLGVIIEGQSFAATFQGNSGQ